ncbi:arginine--tRNA ligase [Blastococcus sp. Marseille-P5729]|uniref:arginine--tRNA ligase n=1 Tax=Blastococcus sp. Marseille-P5729 TaxID=2086582 RepID=UPI000D11020B|nr:arginine--tRNA ligase [Blastococcus sp. Marseille-P5729]
MTPEALSRVIHAALTALTSRGALAVDVPDQIVVERPRQSGHGDFATNIAMRLAKPAGMPPRDLAAKIAAELEKDDAIESVEVAGPGFLNITLNAASLGALAGSIVAAGESYGAGQAMAGQRINLEFVSANPTGPVTLASARWAAVGDALVRIMRACGADVASEYYFNDAGSQIDRFAASLYAAAHGEPVPEDGYRGAYVADVARHVVADTPSVMDQPRDEALETFRAVGIAKMFADIKTTLGEFGVHFDRFFNERELHDGGDVQRSIEMLREKGHIYEQDDALWLRTTTFGDDKDRVLIRGGGAPTYFAADVAYYANKRARGFDRVILILGADHHGYIGRMRAMAAATGDDPDQTLEILIGQMVTLSRDGETVKMSKRAGNVVTLDDLVAAVGNDAGRYAMARSSIDSSMDIDLGLWERRTADNPVFYVQYAHARLSSLQRNARDLGIERGERYDASLLTHEKEVALLTALAGYPRVVASAGELREVHRIARYAEALAADYHRFYDACRVLPMSGAEPDETTVARLWLCEATRVVLANALGLLGVSAPEHM